MTCFSVGWTVGVEFWILPNLNDEYCSFVDSFKPVYSFERRKDGWIVLVSRSFVLLLVYACVEEVSKTHSIGDIRDFVEGSYMDIVKWGEDRVMMLEGGGAKMALPSVEELEKEMEAEEKKEASARSGEQEEQAGEASLLDQEDGAAVDEEM